MRHQKHRYRLSRPTASRKALMRNLSIALFTHQRIVTTLPKAKALRVFAEPLITLGKKGDLAARRRALQVLPNKQAVHVLFNDIAPMFAERNGGYTRILKLTKRHGDAASMAIIELVGYAERQMAAQQVEAEKSSKGKGLRSRLKDKITRADSNENVENAVKDTKEIPAPEDTVEENTESVADEKSSEE